MSAGGGTAVSWKASAGALPKDSAAINPAMANILRIEISPLLKMAFGVTQCKHVWSAVNTLLRLRNFLPLQLGRGCRATGDSPPAAISREVERRLLSSRHRPFLPSVSLIFCHPDGGL